MLTVLATGLVVTFLYLARISRSQRHCPDRTCSPAELSIGTGSTLASPRASGQVTAVTLTVLIAFLAMLGFVAIVLQEISSLAKQLPEYRSNFEDLRQFYVIVTDAVRVFARPIAPFISIYSTI